MPEFLKSMDFGDWGAIASLIFGIVTLIAYLDQRRSARMNKPLLDFARRHADREEVAELRAHREALLEDIETRLPSFARMAVLREQEALHGTAVAYHFNQWKEATDELAVGVRGGSSGTKLDPAIEAAIVDRILPGYEKQQKLDRLRGQILVFVGALAFIGFAFTQEVRLLAGVVIAFPLGDALLRLTVLQAESDAVVAKIRWAGYLLYGAACAACIGFGIILLVYGQDNAEPVGWGFVAGGGVSVILFPVFGKRRIDQRVAVLRRLRGAQAPHG